MKNTQFLNEREVAKVLGLSLQTLRNDRCAPRLNIPYYKIGKSVRYREDEIFKFMETKKVQHER